MLAQKRTAHQQFIGRDRIAAEQVLDLHVANIIDSEMSIYQLANARQHAHMDIACLQRRHDLASADAQRARDRQDDLVHPALFQDARSEEHTSELQSLMRISYAVFCLQKK